ncbi:MAG TPA: hypothetical protein VF145_11720 [Chitinophagaceae bacterium]
MRPTILLPAVTMLLVAILSGCFKDTVVERYSFYRPVYKTRAQVRAAIKTGVAQPITNPGKIFVRGNYIFLNDVNRGIHIIDYSNPSAPRKTGFIEIPGNVDLAVNGNFLYADQFTDLVTIDISNPGNIQVVGFDENVFPQQYYVPDSNLVIAGWEKIDTVIRRKDNVQWTEDILFTSPFSGGPLASSAGIAGKAGSMARFGLMNNRLYTVSTMDLRVFSLSNPADPVFLKTAYVGAGNIETIYPFKDNLFVGSSNGMFIMSVANPDDPVTTGVFSHARACDPVIAEENYAYVTLRSGNRCFTNSNQMDVVDVSKMASPSLVKSYAFTNPAGLSKDGDYIFLCDGTAGLRVLNAVSPLDITTVATIGGFESYDVITTGTIAITVAKDGLYFIDYRSLPELKIISKIPLNR